MKNRPLDNDEWERFVKFLDEKISKSLETIAQYPNENNIVIWNKAYIDMGIKSNLINQEDNILELIKFVDSCIFEFNNGIQRYDHLLYVWWGYKAFCVDVKKFLENIYNER